MFCTKCGNENGDGAVRCGKCGARLMPDAEVADLKRKTGRKPVILVAAVLLTAMVIAIVVGFLVVSGSPSRRLAQQLDLGNRYLSEMEYEQAIAAFEQALEIDQKSAAAYEGLARAYIETEDYASVADVYERASGSLDAPELAVLSDAISSMALADLEALVQAERYDEALRIVSILTDVIDDDRLMEIVTRIQEEMLATVSENQTAENDTETDVSELPLPVSIDTLPEKEILVEFLSDFGWYSCVDEYNCVNPIGIWNFYTFFFGNSALSLEYVYPGLVIVSEGSDPLNNYGGFGRILDADSAEWVLKNIYNWNDTLILSARKDSAPDVFYYEGGQYYAGWAGVGGGFLADIKDALFDGERYYIEYELLRISDSSEGDIISREMHYAEMAYKTFNDKSYWSIYKDSTRPFEAE